MNLNFWPKMYGYGGGGSGGGGAGGGGAAGAGGGTGGAGGGAAGELPPEELTPAGAFRFNTDTAKLEYYDGNQWVNVTTDSPEQNTGGTRGLMVAGGYPVVADIQILNLATTGNAVDSGNDFASNRYLSGATSDRTRGVYFGGYGTTAEIRFNDIATASSTSDFGDLSAGRWAVAGASDGVRGLALGGTAGPSTINAGINEIEYVTIQATGNAVDFGDLIKELAGCSSCNSPTRAITFGGIEDSPNSATTDIEYVTMSTLGNASDFGDLSGNLQDTGSGGGGNAIRGITNVGDAYSNVLEFITIATLGNSQDFGDDVMSRGGGVHCMSSPTRLVIAGGNQPSDSETNTIAYVQIMSTGNAIDFGDLINSKKSGYSVSNGHGGLG